MLDFCYFIHENERVIICGRGDFNQVEISAILKTMRELVVEKDTTSPTHTVIVFCNQCDGECDCWYRKQTMQ